MRERQLEVKLYRSVHDRTRGSHENSCNPPLEPSTLGNHQSTIQSIEQQYTTVYSYVYIFIITNESPTLRSDILSTEVAGKVCLS